MQHTFLNYLFLHLPCIKVLCLSPTSVFFAGHLPPPECRRVPNSSLYLLLSVCLSLLCSPRPPHLSLSLNLSFSLLSPLSLFLHILLVVSPYSSFSPFSPSSFSLLLHSCRRVRAKLKKKRERERGGGGTPFVFFLSLFYTYMIFFGGRVLVPG